MVILIKWYVIFEILFFDVFLFVLFFRFFLLVVIRFEFDSLDKIFLLDEKLMVFLDKRGLILVEFFFDILFFVDDSICFFIICVYIWFGELLFGELVRDIFGNFLFFVVFFG